MSNQKDKLVKSITSRDDDFAQWYTDVCRKAELMDYTDAKGFIIYRPYGYAIWENIQSYLDKEFKRTGHENVYMPLVIPESLFLKEAEHVAGFAPETAIVTIGGKEILQERLIIRPTSEVLFCDHYSKIVSSYRDLPKKYNQWCSVVRWEKTTRPFLRGSEFLWQEGHTIHATEKEAKEEVLGMLDIYNHCGKDLLAIPFVMGQKTDKEKFAGAEETYSIEALMHDGKALQSGTTHYFGTGFAKHFNINFQDKDGVLKPVYQTSWGLSTRLIGAIIMVHGDDSGLVLPPRVAPIQVAIIPIQSQKEGVIEASEAVKVQLETLNYRVKLDISDKSPGWKFSEYEMKGVPIRIEIGPRDLETGECVIVKRVNGEKIKAKIADLSTLVPRVFDEIHEEMYQKALENVTVNTREAKTYEEFKEIINSKPGYVKMMWCGHSECEVKIKEDTTATSRCIPFVQEHITENCPVCGRKAEKMVYFAKAY
ncbi:MAG: proline--tRNA ligase [Tenericutes bacterium HGW-Tenericutes-1]|jgi:prolyl-tRNA synthetase|nr:MAG: proline--tRNA ligase [Tenericutes bacterium HGW-Tenericutes-1]